MERKKSTYIINANLPSEIARIQEQARALLHRMGLFPQRVLPIEPNALFLDIGCGPGDWALETAATYQEATVVGIDINPGIIAYAVSRAVGSGIRNVSFEEINARTELGDLVTASYDSVRLSLAASWLPWTEWGKVIGEAYRLLKRGCWLICIEAELPYTNSEALNTLNRWLAQAMHASGLGFSQDAQSIGVVARMENMLHTAGFSCVDVQAHALDFSYHVEQHKLWYDDLHVFFLLARPFITQYTNITEEAYIAVQDQFVQEAWRPDFCGVGTIYTYTGRKH